MSNESVSKKKFRRLKKRHKEKMEKEEEEECKMTPVTHLISLMRNPKAILFLCLTVVKMLWLLLRVKGKGKVVPVL
jgi:hypothetical protein